MILEPRHSDLVQAFDELAPDYDSLYSSRVNPMMAWMRRENLGLLQEIFPGGSWLLEIGSGTGEEAVALAQAGYTVLASDISPAMVRRTAAKVLEAGLGDRVTSVVLAASQIDALLPMTHFDGAFSSFGSLNLEPDLNRFVSALSRLLKPGANFVCTVVARWCLFEQLWFLSHGQPRLGMRRLRKGWQIASLSGAGEKNVLIPVRPFTARALKKIFQPYFVLERQFSLPLLLPPPYLARLYTRFKRQFDRLLPLERRLRTLWPLRGTGDHLALVFRRQ